MNTTEEYTTEEYTTEGYECVCTPGYTVSDIITTHYTTLRLVSLHVRGSTVRRRLMNVIPSPVKMEAHVWTCLPTTAVPVLLVSRARAASSTLTSALVPTAVATVSAWMELTCTPVCVILATLDATVTLWLITVLLLSPVRMVPRAITYVQVSSAIVHLATLESIVILR